MKDASRTAISERSAHLLHAYRDGELSGFARLRFKRRLRRSPELQRELAALSRIGDWVRESQRDVASPDLWDAIAARLAAVDARRAEPAEAQAAGRPAFAWLAWPGALATAVLAAVFALQWFAPPIPNRIGVVRWVDSGSRDVMVLEPASDTTVVWVIGEPGKPRPRGEDEHV